MRNLLVIWFLFLTQNCLAQVNFNFLDFKIEERDSATLAPCHLLVKSKPDSFLIENIETQKNIAIPLDSSTDFIFIKGIKKIEIYKVLQYCMDGEYSCEVNFNSDSTCTLIYYYDNGNTYEHSLISKNNTSCCMKCSSIDFQFHYSWKDKPKFQPIKK